MQMKKITMLLCLAAVAGCQTWDQRQADQESRYIGKPFDALYDEYGVPIGIAPTSDGGRFIEFRYIRGQYACDARVTADSRGIVTKIKVGGQNGCVM